jgi:hypothetical protein
MTAFPIAVDSAGSAYRVTDLVRINIEKSVIHCHLSFNYKNQLLIR